MSKIAVSLDNFCLICSSYKWKFQCIWISILNVEVIDKSGPQIQGQCSLLRSFTYIGLSLGGGSICPVLFGVGMKILHWGFLDRSFCKSSSMYLYSVSWICIKQVHALYVTHCITIIFLLLKIIAVLDVVGDNLWRVYRGLRVWSPFIWHLAEL